ncbi:MAG: hypothetical protein JSW33_08530 [bacterium]|nr:MAG: hypothetical protein JSW33_08530 [bacterium]
MNNRDKYFTRRRIIKTGGAVLAGSAWSMLHSQTTESDKLDQGFLNRFGSTANSYYCRHACRECISGCPQRVPVSTIMRYAYYFQNQQREKEAREKYARLLGRHAPSFAYCDTPCLKKCPDSLNIQT